MQALKVLAAALVLVILVLLGLGFHVPVVIVLLALVFAGGVALRRGKWFQGNPDAMAGRQADHTEGMFAGLFWMAALLLFLTVYPFHWIVPTWFIVVAPTLALIVVMGLWFWEGRPLVGSFLRLGVAGGLMGTLLLGSGYFITGLHMGHAGTSNPRPTKDEARTVTAVAGNLNPTLQEKTLIERMRRVALSRIGYDSTKHWQCESDPSLPVRLPSGQDAEGPPARICALNRAHLNSGIRDRGVYSAVVTVYPLPAGSSNVPDAPHLGMQLGSNVIYFRVLPDSLRRQPNDSLAGYVLRPDSTVFRINTIRAYRLNQGASAPFSRWQDNSAQACVTCEIHHWCEGS